MLKQQTYRKGTVGFFVCIIFLYYAIRYFPSPKELYDYCAVPYLLTYEFGFITRALVGSILHVFFPYLSVNTLWFFLLSVNILMIALIAVMCERTYQAAEESHKNAMLYLIALFCINPGSAACLFYWGNFGRMEMYMIIASLICAYLIIEDKILWMVPILSACCTMIHHKFIFLFFPLILLLLLYRTMRDKSKKILFTLLVTLISSSALFLYFQFFSDINVGTVTELTSVLRTRTNYPIDPDENVLYYLFYAPFSETFLKLSGNSLLKRLAVITMTIILLLPLWIVMIKIWFSNSFKKTIYKLFPLFIIVCSAPAFILTIDNGRDFSAIIISMFILVFFMYRMNDVHMHQVFDSISLYIKNHQVISFLGALWLSVLGKMEGAVILHSAEAVVLFIRNLLPF